MKESMITITDYMLLVKKCASIRCAKHYQENREKFWKKPNYFEKTTMINLNKIENQLFHMRKVNKILKIKLTP